MPVNWKLESPNSGFSHRGHYEVSYPVNHIIRTMYNPKDRDQTDTLCINNILEATEVRHKYLGLDNFGFLVYPGDTVVFKYRGRTPVAQITNRKYLDSDLNYELLRRKHVIRDSLTSFVKFTNLNYAFIKVHDITDMTRDSLLKEEQKKVAYLEIEDELELLEDLLSKGKITEASYQYNKNRCIVERATIGLWSGDGLNLNLSDSDSLLTYEYFQEFLRTFLRVKFQDKIEPVKVGNGSLMDYRSLYDSINEMSHLGVKIREFLLYECLSGIVKHFSLENRMEYYNRFIESYSFDSVTVKHISSAFGMTEQISGDISLIDSDGKRSTFSDLLRKNQGKFVYVDLWASWCAPCRKALPASFELNDLFNQDRLTFVYLAVNDNYDQWLKASKEVGLGTER